MEDEKKKRMVGKRGQSHESDATNEGKELFTELALNKR